MKRLVTVLCILLIFTFSLSVIANAEKTEITWMSWGHSVPQEIRNKALEMAFPELAEKYVISPIVAPNGAPGVADKLRMMMASGEELPDIWQLNSPLFPEFAEVGIGADVTDYFTGVTGLLDGVIDMCTYNGRQYAFPYCLNTLMWFYRADMMEEAGVDINAIQNVDDLIIAGKKFREKFPESGLIDLTPGTLNGMYQFVMNGSGTTYWNAEKGAYDVKNNEIIRAILTDLKKLYDAGISVEINSWTPDWEQGFADGTIAGTLLCNWFKDPAFLSKYSAENIQAWGARLWPTIAGISEGSENGGAMIFVNKNSPNKDAAIEILSKLCFTVEGNLAMYEAGGKGTLVLIMEDAFSDPSVANGDNFWLPSALETEKKAFSVFRVMDFNPASALETSIANVHVEKFFRGDISLDETLAAIENDLTSQIGNPHTLN